MTLFDLPPFPSHLSPSPPPLHSRLGAGADVTAGPGEPGDRGRGPDAALLLGPGGGGGRDAAPAVRPLAGQRRADPGPVET